MFFEKQLLVHTYLLELFIYSGKHIQTLHYRVCNASTTLRVTKENQYQTQGNNVGRVRTPEPASCHGLSGRPIRGHNIITKKELHAHNTFSNGNQVISSNVYRTSHENTQSYVVTLLCSDVYSMRNTELGSVIEKCNGFFSSQIIHVDEKSFQII